MDHITAIAVVTLVVAAMLTTFVLGWRSTDTYKAKHEAYRHGQREGYQAGVLQADKLKDEP